MLSAGIDVIYHSTRVLWSKIILYESTRHLGKMPSPGFNAVFEAPFLRYEFLLVIPVPAGVYHNDPSQKFVLQQGEAESLLGGFRFSLARLDLSTFRL